MNQQEESVENIFGDSLKLLVGQDLSETADDGQLVYGSLRLTVAPKVLYARLGLPRPIRSQAYFTSLPQGREGTSGFTLINESHNPA
jgi:hypothetical protein